MASSEALLRFDVIVNTVTIGGRKGWGESVRKKCKVNDEKEEKFTYTCCLMASFRSAEVAVDAPVAPLPVNELRSMFVSVCLMLALRLER